ncbi:MAG: 2-oxo acid dehydrogenase subunit E2 [Deinococcales bacterium]|nr:2-oxo acid dehydrogenase subunit E2 [Deinococcales bacterium]
MPREFLLPELAESVVEGELVSWLVQEGEGVSEDQPIVEVMTDKVTVELPSPFSGILERHLVAEGDVVEVNRPIALFSEEGESGVTDGDRASYKKIETKVTDEEDGEALTLFTPSSEEEDTPIFQVRTNQRDRLEDDGEADSTSSEVRVLAVPAARKLARELGLEIQAIQGTGPKGRIQIEDVKTHAKRGTIRSSDTATLYVSPSGYEELEERLPFRGIRRATSNQMVASHLQTVRTLHVDEADVSRLVRVRSRLKPIAAERGISLSYLPFIMKAVASALKSFPSLNSSLDEEAGEIVLKKYVNVSMAVATETGLVVPVVHNVDRKGLLEIATDILDKATKARKGGLTKEDVSGGSFSITNVGSLGGLFSFPIINIPEAAILGVHTIKKRPVVLDDESIVARPMVYLSLSFDHRLVDGAEAVAFTSQLIQMIEDPERLLLEF